MIKNNTLIRQFPGEISVLKFLDIFKEGCYRLYSLEEIKPQFNQTISDMLECKYPFKAFYGIRNKDGALELFYPHLTIKNLVSHLMVLSDEEKGRLDRYNCSINLIEIVPIEPLEWEEKRNLVESIMEYWSLTE